MMKPTRANGKADYIGIAGSVLCILHCLIVPTLAFSSTLAHSHHADSSLISLDYFFILVNGIAVFYATRDHKSLPLRIFLWGALSLFAVSLIFEHQYQVFTWLGYIGSGLLIVGHLANIYICQFAGRAKVSR
jgi:hypothetical protein